VSYATQKWSNTTLDELIEHWLVCHEKFEQDKQHIRRPLVLKYESFVENPQYALDTIYSFIGLPSHPNQVEVRSDVNEKYLEKWRENRNDAVSEDRTESSRIVLQYGRRVATFTYSFSV
jgi:hypothetical protein